MNGTYKQQNQQNLNVDQTLSYIGLYVDWMDNPMGLAMWEFGSIILQDLAVTTMFKVITFTADNVKKGLTSSCQI